MYRRFQNRFGTAGVVVAVVALIAALSGTALAASGALTGKQKKEVEKIAKKYAGKDGAAGTNGTNGKDGAPGAAGKEGAAGAAGKEGTSATVVSFTGSKGTCTKGQGGIEVKSASATTFVCNGEAGKAGEAGESPFGSPFAGNAEPTGNPCAGAGGVTYTVEGVESNVCNGKAGSPWTLGTLPPGATETGVFAFTGFGTQHAPLSFPVPLAANAEVVHFKQSGGPADPLCTGKLTNPTAAPGVLCIYYADMAENASEHFVEGPDGSTGAAARPGVNLYWQLPAPGEPEEGRLVGSFAVTGCSEVPGAEFACPAP